ncbi:hypothetical protein EsH8_III_000140 [Colletotrichum jinshuiense]
MGAHKPVVNSFKRIAQLIAIAITSGKSLKDQRLHDTAPIGTVDRFDNGAVFPTGLGVNQTVHKFDYSTILNAREVESALHGLGKEYGVQLIHAPHESYWGHKSLVGFVPRNNSTGRRGTRSHRAFLTAGANGRERGGPDSLIYFISDLLWANKHNEDLQYNAIKFTVGQVRRVLSLGIILFPVVNPDGLVWDQRWNNCWGKNLNWTSRRHPFTLDGMGVNVDRNYNFAWDYRRVFSDRAGDVSSDNPSHELFHGRGPFSEAESRNVAWVFNTHAQIRWFLDVHSGNRVITHPWTHAVLQATNPEQNWRNRRFDGKRGDLAAGYGEYMVPKDLSVYRDVAANVAAQMSNVTGAPFKDASALRAEGKSPPAASGSAIDWVYSRHIVNDRLGKTYSFKLSLGASEEEAYNVALRGGCSYYPTSKQYHDSIQESAVGYMTFLLNAAKYEAMAAGGGEV